MVATDATALLTLEVVVVVIIDEVVAAMVVAAIVVVVLTTTCPGTLHKARILIHSTNI